MELVLTRLRPQHLRGLALLVAAGIAADIAWELWARVVTTAVIGGPLQPASLILSLFRLPEDYRLFAEGLHLATGALFYPLLFLLIRRAVFSGGTLVDGLIVGVVTWVLALGVFAPLAGLPFMLGFIPLAWMSGIGHLCYGLVLAFVYDRLTRDAA
jgi:hypothetical protein